MQITKYNDFSFFEFFSRRSDIKQQSKVLTKVAQLMSLKNKVVVSVTNGNLFENARPNAIRATEKHAR